MAACGHRVEAIEISYIFPVVQRPQPASAPVDDRPASAAHVERRPVDDMICARRTGRSASPPRRSPSRINGRFFLPPDQRRYPCRTIDMSAEIVALRSDYRPAVGEKVSLDLDRWGRFDGAVIRLFDGGFTWPRGRGQAPGPCGHAIRLADAAFCARRRAMSLP